MCAASNADTEPENNPLWPLIVEAAHALWMFNHHKTYVRDNILPGTPDITSSEIRDLLEIPLAEAMVILHELRYETTPTPTRTVQPRVKPQTGTLTDYA